MGDKAKFVWFIQHPSARIWSVNPYKACGIRCVYCIARSQGKAQPWFDSACVVDELRKRLANVPQHTELFVGALVDAYPPEEERLGVTRLALTELSLQARPFCISTKSSLVQRDSDILLRHKGHCDVFMSLCSMDQGMISRLEINAPSVSDRLLAVSVLHHAGIDVSIDAAPWIPGSSDINALLDAIPAEVRVQVAPLDIRHIGHEATIAGMRFTQEQINMAYDQHRKTVGNNHRVKWKDPIS
jgi:DNA repair photolyase